MACISKHMHDVTHTYEKLPSIKKQKINTVYTTFARVFFM